MIGRSVIARGVTPERFGFSGKDTHARLDRASSWCGREPRHVVTPRRLPAILAGLLAALLAGLACSAGPPTSSATTLTVLAGSELKDLEPLLPDLEKATGYHLSLNYVGSLDGAERIVNGDRSQLAWFSSGKYRSR